MMAAIEAFVSSSQYAALSFVSEGQFAAMASIAASVILHSETSSDVSE